jgi:hypothetical protein
VVDGMRTRNEVSADEMKIGFGGCVADVGLTRVVACGQHGRAPLPPGPSDICPSLGRAKKTTSNW